MRPAPRGRPQVAPLSRAAGQSWGELLPVKLAAKGAPALYLRVPLMRDPHIIYITFAGLPVRVELEWPFHSSGSGADWFSLHGRLWLEDGGPLHADVAVNLT